MIDQIRPRAFFLASLVANGKEEVSLEDIKAGAGMGMPKGPRLGQAQRGVIAAVLCLAVVIGVFDGKSSKPPESPKYYQGTKQTKKETNNWSYISTILEPNDPISFYTLFLAIFSGILVGVSVVQIRYLIRADVTARRASIAARRSAIAARQAAAHVPRVERAYLFLDLDFNSHILAFTPGLEHTKSFVEFGFKNHGKTPAIVEELHVMAGFWGASWPAMETAQKMVIQKGWVIGAGETQGGYKTEFLLRMDEVTRARNRNGYILFWGKILYRDVFRERHDSGWCRAYYFEAEGWRFAGDETLNYYT